MPKLSDVLGAILAEVSAARRIGDEHAVRIADAYQAEPLLRGLPVPRVRLPAVTIDLPIIVDRHDAGAGAEWRSAADLITAVGQNPPGALARQLPLAAQQEFSRELGVVLATVQNLPNLPDANRRQALYSAIDEAIGRTKAVGSLPAEGQREFRAAVPTIKREILSIAVKTPSRPPSVEVSVETAQVKASADPNTVTRVRLTLREEGLEWSDLSGGGDPSSARLTPE